MKLNIFTSLIFESFVEADHSAKLSKTKTDFNTFRVYDEEEFRKNYIKALKRLINTSKEK